MSRVEIISLIVVVAAIVAEAIWSNLRKKEAYTLKESLANIFIMTGNNLLKPTTLAWLNLIFTLLEPWQLVRLPTNVWTVILAFLAVELVYYWYHRLSHEMPFLWTIHHTHHSSPWMNFTTALRMNWLGGFVMPVFFGPIVLLGFSTDVLTGCLAFVIVYQFILHTQIVGRLGFVEGKFFNTPSAHRVHHGKNDRYIDKNYGATLIIYDRLFGTYEPEVEEVDYGVTSGFPGHNPMKILFLPLVQFFRRNENVKRQVKN